MHKNVKYIQYNTWTQTHTLYGRRSYPKSMDLNAHDYDY